MDKQVGTAFVNNYDALEEYDDDKKAQLWAAFWNGYDQGRGVESATKIMRNSANTQFEIFWERNIE